MEDKQKICNALLKTLQLTRDLDDLQALNYNQLSDDVQVVNAVFGYGTKNINVSWDSGAAMIRDIMRALK